MIRYALTALVTALTIAAFAAPATAAPTTVEHSSGQEFGDIFDNTNTIMTENVPGGVGRIVDVNVQVRLDHTFLNDLKIMLRSGNGGTTVLSQSAGGAADDLGSGADTCESTFVTFDDEAPNRYLNYHLGPFTGGSYMPLTPLSGFDRTNYVDSWSLHVHDTSPGDQGMIHCWKLVFKVDVEAPTVSLTKPSAFHTVALSSSTPFAWTGSDASTSVSRYRMAYSTTNADGTGTINDQILYQGTGKTTSKTWATGKTHCVTPNAWDQVLFFGMGTTKCVYAPFKATSADKTGSWSNKTGRSGHYRAQYATTKSQGATLTSNTAAISTKAGIVATKCPGCGTVDVHIGATKLGTLNLHSSTVRKQRLYLFAVPAGPVSDKIKVTVTSKNKPVMIEGLAWMND
jgi:subtilisin-like proprotein convertase family protein